MTLESDIIECVVHIFKMGYVEDPDLYAAQSIWEWQQTEEGKWIMEHGRLVPSWNRFTDPVTYGFQYAITGYLSSKDYVFWKLKYK